MKFTFMSSTKGYVLLLLRVYKSKHVKCLLNVIPSWQSNRLLPPVAAGHETCGSSLTCWLTRVMQNILQHTMAVFYMQTSQTCFCSCSDLDIFTVFHLLVQIVSAHSCLHKNAQRSDSFLLPRWSPSVLDWHLTCVSSPYLFNSI